MKPTPFVWRDPTTIPPRYGLEFLDAVEREHDCGFSVAKDGITLFWGGYDYHVSKESISTPGEVCGWIAHIGEKEWEGCTAERMREFVIAAYDLNGWGYPSC